MKNIHVLPTEKPSRFSLNSSGKYHLTNQLHTNSPNFTNQNIYITDDSEIKEDYVSAYGVIIKVMMFDVETLYFVNGTKAKREDCKKIILTTDQDLIKDGVQAIDDDFLEWFVKNSSRESVEVVYERIVIDEVRYNFDVVDYKYKIIIPQEEPEEVRKVERTELFNSILSITKQIPRKNIEEDAMDASSCAYEIEKLFYKWQQEQDKNKYSEEELKEAFRVGFNVGYNDAESPSYLKFEEWLNNLKNKI